MLSQPQLPVAGQILLGILVLVAAVYDIRFRRIPNWLVACGIVAGFAWNIYSLGIPGLGRAAAGFGLGFGLYFPLWLLRARGAGDVKLLAAAGSIIGAGNCFLLFLLTAILGGAIALIYVIFRGRLQHTFFNVTWIARDLMRFRAPHKSSEELDVTTAKGMRLPHAAMIAVGAIALIYMTRYRVVI